MASSAASASSSCAAATNAAILYINQVTGYYAFVNRLAVELEDGYP